MKVIVGLGNPGTQYQTTRHNAGSMFVEFFSQKLASDYGWRAHKEALVFETAVLLLAKPKDRFMNESGIWVNQLLKNTNEPELYLAHDDLDIKLGEYKIQKGVGPKVHNGVGSVEQYLGSDFWRIRIGIDNRDVQNRMSGEEYVLQRFTDEEVASLERVFDAITQTINQ